MIKISHEKSFCSKNKGNPFLYGKIHEDENSRLLLVI
jgi:hypothetical protein